jgi:hypothetical protein
MTTFFIWAFAVLTIVNIVATFTLVFLWFRPGKGGPK